VSNKGLSRTVEVADNFDFSIGRKHAMRVGAMFEGGRYENFDARNAAGTFTFGDLASYNAGQPLQFTQRRGEVVTSFNQYEFGLYWQDDVRVNKNLSVSLGVRQEMQSLISDKLNVMPRFGATWNAPGKVVIRGGYGRFYDWYDTALYDQTLRVNGVAQRDLLILSPGYPNPLQGADPTVLPGGRVQEAPELSLPYIHQASIGAERAITANLQFQASYQMLRGRNLMRAINVNAPDADGVRPEPTVGVVTQFESTGRSQSDRLTTGLQYRMPRRRVFIGGNYTLGQLRNYADSATSLPANSLDPNAEWGPALLDVRHRVNWNFNVPFVLAMRLNVTGVAQSAAPYNITTGLDGNQDGIVNDRPAGVTRNSARGAQRFDMSVRLSRTLAFGPSRGTPAGPGRAVGLAQGPGGRGGGDNPGGGRGPDAFGGAAAQRFTADLWISASNVFNYVNYLTFVGNQRSPLYGQATSASQPRRFETGVNFRF